MPSVELKDGVDYVPARKGIIFGHHFTSIAGTGPIVGPAIGIIWGWLPAVLWVFLGSIFMGAVHDFGSLVVSMRNEGKSISEVAAKYINMRVRFIFFAVVFLSLLIVIAIFGVVIAAVFTTFPSAVIPVWDAQELGVNQDMVGLSGSATRVTKVFFPQRVHHGEIFQGSAESQAESLVNKLRGAKLI